MRAAARLRAALIASKLPGSAFAESGWNRLLRATSSVLLAEPGPIGEEPIERITRDPPSAR